MLLNVKLGYFRPDGTRSGYMKDAQVNLLEKPEAAALRTEAGAESVVPSPSTIVEEAPPAEVEKVDASAMETFDPTNPFQMPEAPQEGSEAMHEDDVVEGDDLLESASSESGESACGTEVNEELFHQKHNSVLNSGVEPVAAGALMQNKRSRMLHRQCGDPSNNLQPVTECGLRGKGFVILGSGAAFDWPKCSKCFKVQAAPSGLSSLYSATKRKRQG
eukprot:s916_g3.t1